MQSIFYGTNFKNPLIIADQFFFSEKFRLVGKHVLFLLIFNYSKAFNKYFG
jgi:hypothetical protein